MESTKAWNATATPWQVRWRSLAQSNLWFWLLTGVGCASTVTYAHPPLVALGVMAGATLIPRRAVMAAIAIWLANQLYGYTLRQYPLTLESLGWGAAMGLGLGLVTLLATVRPPFSQNTLRGHLLWVVAALGGGFVLFETLILSLGWLMTQDHVLTWSVLGWLLVKEALWAVVLTLIHTYLMIFRKREMPLQSGS